MCLVTALAKKLRNALFEKDHNLSSFVRETSLESNLNKIKSCGVIYDSKVQGMNTKWHRQISTTVYSVFYLKIWYEVAEISKTLSKELK